MNDNRDFDFRQLPAIAEMLASGVPESMDLSREATTDEMQVMIQALNWHEPQTQAAFIDQLTARVEELERERDELRARLEKELLGVYRQRDDFRSQVALLWQEIARLEALNATLRRQGEGQE